MDDDPFDDERTREYYDHKVARAEQTGCLALIFCGLFTLAGIVYIFLRSFA